MSGPSAIAKPMSAKIAVSWSITWLLGCPRPISAGGSRTGSVTSTVSVLRRRSSAASLSAARRAAIAAVTRSLSPLMSGPCSRRSSGVIVPSVLSSAETEPLLPSAATRAASSAASSAAAAMAPTRSRSSAARSDIASLRQQDQVGVGRLAAGLREHAVHLAAMVRLMIEHVHDELPFRLGQLALGGARVPGKVARQPVRIELVGPADHRRVEGVALALEAAPLGIERDRSRDAALGRRHVGREAAHPDAVCP